MTLVKDLQSLLDSLEPKPKLGITGSGHISMANPDNGQKTVIPSTPSDPRSIRTVRVKARRMGFRIISKSDLRREKREKRRMTATKNTPQNTPQDEIQVPILETKELGVITLKEARADIALAGYAVWEAITKKRTPESRKKVLGGLPGWIWEGSRDKVLRDLWDLECSPRNVHDPFRADLSKYLRGSKNLVVFKRGGPYASRWWVSDVFHADTFGEARKTPKDWWQVETSPPEDQALLDRNICPECRPNIRHFATKQAIGAHRWRVHGVTGNAYSSRLQREKRTREAEGMTPTTPTQKTFACTLCPFKTVNENSYVSHINRTDHTRFMDQNKGVFTCPFCPQDTEVRLGLMNFRAHLNKAHRKSFCPKCESYLEIKEVASHRQTHRSATPTTTPPSPPPSTPKVQSHQMTEVIQTGTSTAGNTTVYVSQIEPAPKYSPAGVLSGFPEPTASLEKTINDVAIGVRNVISENDRLREENLTLRDKNAELTSQLAKYRTLAESLKGLKLDL